MLKTLVRILLAAGLMIAAFPLSTEPASAHSLGSQAFERTWARTDLPVAQGQVNRTWMWGPSGHTAAFEEPYFDAPGGTRLVQYTDKSRMEDNAHAAAPPWDVTNGLLATELITGRMQLGDTEFQQMQPANVQIAGDSHPDSPTYATFNGVLNYDPLPIDHTITQTIDQFGNVGDNPGLGQHGVAAARYVPETDHTVASVFWEFMNSTGQVFENGQFLHSRLFENPFFATGFPITEAYWMNVPVGGEQRDVLSQCFERRCLTYTPGNSAGWQVEAGNIGQHYYRWRYGDSPVAPPPPDHDPDEIAYVEDVVFIVEATAVSFEVLAWLLDNPTFSNAWYSEFDEVMELWRLLYPAMDSLEPPPGYEAFHAKMLDAYWVLGQAADDIQYGFYYFDEYALEQGLIKLEQFLVLFEEAFDLLPDSPQDPVFLERGDTAPFVDPLKEVLNPDRWEGIRDL